MSDRQATAGAVLVIMALAVPIVVGLGLLFVTAWFAGAKTFGLVGMHDIHGTFWGWLSERHHYTDKSGRHVNWRPNTVPLAWIMLWVTLWFFYECAEGVGLLVGSFARLARPNKVEVFGPPKETLRLEDFHDDHVYRP
jgi:hypothetical protein